MQVDGLNEDVLCQIFCYLPLEDWLSCSFTCRKWHRLFLNFLWPTVTRLDLKNHFRQPVLAHYDQLDARLLRSVFRWSGCHIQQFKATMTSCARRSRRCFAARLEMTRPIMMDIAQQCTQLTVFNLSGFVFRSFDCFSCLRLLPRTLTVLQLQWCRLDHYGPFVGAVDALFRELMDRYKNLEQLSVRGCCYGCWLMTENALSHGLTSTLRTLDLAENYTAKIRHLNWTSALPELVELHLERAAIGEQDLLALVRSCPNMETLTIAYSSSITDFSCLSTLRRLRHLVLNGNRDHFDDAALSVICRYCPFLETLSLESCSSLSEAGLLAVADASALRYLNVTSVQMFSDKCLQAVCRSCNMLSNLQIKYCQRLTRFGLESLLLLERLRRLGVSGLKEFDGALLDALQWRARGALRFEADNCPKLKPRRSSLTCC